MSENNKKQWWEGESERANEELSKDEEEGNTKEDADAPDLDLDADADENTHLLKKTKKSVDSKGKRKVIIIESHAVRRGWGLLFFDSVCNLSTLISLCLFLCQILPIIFTNDSSIGPVQMALRCYMAVFCILAITAEQEIILVNNLPILQNWILRGLIYSFLGIVGLDESEAINYKTDGTPSLSFEHASVFILLSSSAMIAVGILYFLMGILFLQLFRDNLVKKYNEKLAKEIMKQEIINENTVEDESD